MATNNRLGSKEIAVVVSVLLGLLMLLVYLFGFHYTAQSEVSIRHNFVTGEVTQNEAGAYFTAPWVLVSTLDMRPKRVCVSTTANVLRCKLVQWSAKDLAELVRREGFHYYWWNNRISFNFGYSEEYRGERDLARGYAFDEQTHPFLIEVQETK